MPRGRFFSIFLIEAARTDALTSARVLVKHFAIRSWAASCRLGGLLHRVSGAGMEAISSVAMMARGPWTAARRHLARTYPPAARQGGFLPIGSAAPFASSGGFFLKFIYFFIIWWLFVFYYFFFFFFLFLNEAPQPDFNISDRLSLRHLVAFTDEETGAMRNHPGGLFLLSLEGHHSGTWFW